MKSCSKTLSMLALGHYKVINIKIFKKDSEKFEIKY